MKKSPVPKTVLVQGRKPSLLSLVSFFTKKIFLTIVGFLTEKGILKVTPYAIKTDRGIAVFKNAFSWVIITTNVGNKPITTIAKERGLRI